MRKRSSFHFISGDEKLSRLERMGYRLSYRAERLMAQMQKSAYMIDVYRPALDEDKFVQNFGAKILSASPSRILCFDFLAEHGAALFGPDSSVADLGCGKGPYIGHISRAFGYRHYIGYDIAPSPAWPAYEDVKTAFHSKNLGVEPIDLSDVDIVFSQSVLEHVAYDAAVFKLLSAKPGRQVRHLHFILATASFHVYKFHGYRRYAPYQIDRLLSAPGISDVKIYAMCNALTRAFHLDHYEFLRGGFISRNARSPYDPDKSMYANLTQHKERLHPPDIQEADFFALTFKQEVG